MPDQPPPFTKYLRILEDRAQFLTKKIMESSDDKATSFYNEELGALTWALLVLKGELDSPVDANWIKQQWIKKNRGLKEMDEEYWLFCDFLEWRDKP